VQTVADLPAATKTAHPVTRETAVKFYATGRTAGELRAQAANPWLVRDRAKHAGVSPRFIRDEMLAIADGIEEVAATGLTPELAYFALGLDLVLGRFPGAVSPSRPAAAR
jgi:hypothetical protein